MSTSYYRGLISATTRKEAEDLLDSLTQDKLVAGGMIMEGQSRYWWKDQIAERTYYNLSIFTTSEKRKSVIDRVRSRPKDDVPIVAFFAIDSGNEEFLGWIQQSVASA